MGPRGPLPPPRPTPAPGTLPEGIARGGGLSRWFHAAPGYHPTQGALAHVRVCKPARGERTSLGEVGGGGGLCSRCLPSRHSSRNPETWRARADAITLGEGAPPLRGPGDLDTAGLILAAWPHLVFFLKNVCCSVLHRPPRRENSEPSWALWSPHEPFGLLPRRPGNSFLLQTLQLSPGLRFPP